VLTMRNLLAPIQWHRPAGWFGLLLLLLLAQGCGSLSQLSKPVPAAGAINRPALVRPYAPTNDKAQASTIKSSGHRPSPQESLKMPGHEAVGRSHTGEASWYGPGFNGKKTASGEIFDDSKLTAAHKTLPLGTKARVTRLSTGDSVDVEINDRGPFIAGRIIDLSKAAARALGMIGPGTATVRVELLSEWTDSKDARFKPRN
jgi:rare lipoprotein A (peptidoglycan hydrolase)